MKIRFFFLFACLTPVAAYAQHAYLGIQNSTRKSMVSVMMNPAEINNFERKLEVNFVSVNALFLNNVLSLSEIAGTEGSVWQHMMEKANGPVNGDSHGSVLMPSFGVNLGKWSLGWANQFNSRGSILQVNPSIGSNITKTSNSEGSTTIRLENHHNQRVNGVMWIESGVVVGREILNNNKVKLSLGTNLKLLIPINYTNAGLSQLQGTLILRDGEAILSDASGVFHLAYNRNLVDAKHLRLDYGNLELKTPNSFGLDLGANFQAKQAGKVWLNAGASINNIGQLNFEVGNTSNYLRMNIPHGHEVSLDLLHPSLERTVEQLVGTGYFTADRTVEGFSVGLPTTFSLYSDFRVYDRFFVSLFWQQLLKDQEENFQVPFVGVFAITPSMQFGKFEVFSPWSYLEISHLVGGIGLRYGGFFLSSQTVLTALFADYGTADAQVGFSWGFGNKR